MMEAVTTPETSVQSNEIKRRYIPEDSNFQTCRRENLTSHKDQFIDHFKERIVVYSENHTEAHKDTFWVKVQSLKQVICVASPCGGRKIRIVST
jgi:hypothetical protein